MPHLLFAVDEAWLQLLYYKKDGNGYSNNSYLDSFFVSKEGRTNPEQELKASLIAIKDNRKVGQLKKAFACAFPARYEYLKNKYPHLKKKFKCPEFEHWKNEIGAKEVFLVYASSYVSNPASMFGHSFLRLSRGGKTKSDALLDYSVGFMAITNPDDNPVMYSVKGIIGSYVGHFDVKPFYMQVGLYQNAEDRDLWEYKLPLGEEETDLLVKHLWEVSRNTGFPYYFFDDNCSLYVLKLIEAVRPEWKITKKKKYLFAHPIETLKWAANSVGVIEVKHYESINKVLRRRIKNMSSREKKLFGAAKKDMSKLDQVKSLKVLDALIDYWKFENYDKNTNLTLKEKKIMNRTFLIRSQLEGTPEGIKEVLRARGEDPKDFHDPNKLSFKSTLTDGNHFFKLGYQLGYHSLVDNPIGHDDYSYIDYFGLNLRFKDRLILESVKLVEINSHAPFVWQLPKLSWRIDSQYQDRSAIFDRDNFLLDGGLGITFFSSRNMIYSFLGLENRFYKEGVYLIPKFSLGAKLVLGSFLFHSEYNLRRIDDLYKNSFKASFNYFLNSGNGVSVEAVNSVGREQDFSIGLGYKIYL